MDVGKEAIEEGNGDASHMLDLQCDLDDPTFDQVDVHIQENMEDEFIQEALQSGMDLRQYSLQVEKDLQNIENLAIEDYIEESLNIASLHNQIVACDQILEHMEKMLKTFQEDLGSISQEILTLQQQSVSMNIRLKNRQAVRGQLSQFVDDIVVPNSMINRILETPVTEKEFLEQLYVLDHKISFVKEQSFRDFRSCQDVKEILDGLKYKSIAKVREYLLQKVYSFRKPTTNYQVPQNAMLKHKFFYQFLMAHDRETAQDVREEYVTTMGKVLFSYFKSYTSQLMKLQFEEVPEKDDLMGVEDTTKRSLFSSKPSLKNRSTVFTLGSRNSVLTSELESPIIVPHTSQKSDLKYPFESLFRSQQYALVDNACREYLFITEFFVCSGTVAQEVFNIIMNKTTTMILKHMEVYAQDCYDSVALFLCIHIIHRYQLLMHERNVPALDRYWESLLQLMHPRFECILKLNIQSIKDCDPQKLRNIDMRPHYGEVENFILRMAAEFPGRKEQLIFLINNYDMMLSVLLERTKEDSKESESFKELLTARTQEYVEEVLAPHFGGMIMFVKECEMLQERGLIEQMRKEEKKVSSLVRSFNMGWKKAIDDINNDIMQTFTNFRNGTNILQAALTQLIQYYHRFQKVLGLPPFKQSLVRAELLNIHHLMVEVKKYKPNF
ncbi:vacuolar protein sorting-associated protein 52 homolog isoform X2 [Ornithodoros turicata]|uniref:vacuolar protein sorting-associated protein 52 homolog isoform X2 n=1 Tax=Ornithodoros turicata TaxID=34597 RepID=UPI00313A4096